jgi:hypothetical protein
MARGRDAHDARVAAVAALGRSLARRAGSVCELCGSGDGCRVVEVPPLSDDPDLERALLQCDACTEALGARRLDGASLRHLTTAAWGDPVPVKLVAIRGLRRLAEQGELWARDALDALWIPEDVSELLGDAP